MKRLPVLNIRKRTLLLGLLPAVLMYVLLVSLFVWQHMQDVKKDVATVGKLLSRQLAASIEYPVISGNFQLLEPLVESAIQGEEVIRISIRDAQGQMLYERSSELYPELLAEDIETYSQPVTQDVQEFSELDEFAEDDVELSQPTRQQQIALLTIELTQVVGRDEALIIVAKSMLWITLVLLLCVALARRMANSIAQPVEQLTKVVSDITQGQYDSRTPVTDGAELGELQKSANEMAEALRDAEIAQENAMQESIDARLKAEQASKAKSEFLAIVSHELRTPINGAMGAVQLMTDCSEDELKEYIGVADYSLGYLMELVEDMLTLVSSESNELEIVKDYISIESALQNTLSSLSLAAKENKNQLHIRFDELLHTHKILTDSAKVRQLIRHLVGNAVKFTASGYINVAMYLQSGTTGTALKIEIADSGVGIPQEKKDAIFEPFQQADSSFTRKFDGAGIGLTVCASIIEALGGELVITDNLPMGTRVECTIPTTIRKVQSDERSCGLVQSGRALVVEDNQVNRMVAEKMLNKVSLQAVTVESGDECLDRIRNEEYDLIFMDCHMPGMDGFVTTKEIRKAERLKSSGPTPIIALTANTSTEIKQRCLDAGMNDYLAKPLKVEHLKEVIGRWLQ